MTDKTHLYKGQHYIRGEFRPPMKGEKYLSGAVPSIYEAPNDLSTPFRIMVPLTMEHGEAAQEGCQAAFRGEARNNPYPLRSTLRSAWFTGYDKGLAAQKEVLNSFANP